MGNATELTRFRNRLEHWRMPGSVYFVTWPIHPDQQSLSKAERSLVAETITLFADDRYTLFAYVVMDDHVHVLVRPSVEYSLSSILHSWKSYPANRMQRLHNRRGSIWQKDNFERIIRDQDELLAKAEYILNNPEKRWPGTRGYQWVEWFAEAFG